MRLETFPALEAIPFLQHAFTLRAGNDTRSDAFEEELLRHFGYGAGASAEQTHGSEVAVVTSPVTRAAGVDALATHVTGLPLVIRCADCAAVFVVDRATPAIALIHSGKKGTIANVTSNTLATMGRAFGTAPGNCVAVISPSIGPCHYEMDIWAGLERQLRETGVSEIHNPRICTGCRLDRYYSYRVEKGQTGRMLALLAIKR